MFRKPNRVVSKALGGGESVNQLKKAMMKVFNPSDDKVERKTLEPLTRVNLR